jgi:hypothetical protein
LNLSQIGLNLLYKFFLVECVTGSSGGHFVNLLFYYVDILFKMLMTESRKAFQFSELVALTRYGSIKNWQKHFSVQ